MHLHKKGIRVLGIAESFRKQGKKALLAGVVMRADLQIDGFSFARITLGGLDATKGVLEIFYKLKRSDINAIMLNGCIISLFNLVELEEVYEKTKLPVLCITYEESPGLEPYLAKLEDAEERLRIYRSLGERSKVELHTGKEVFVRWLGISEKQAKALLNKFTLQGSIPEPLKVARLLARSLSRFEHA